MWSTCGSLRAPSWLDPLLALAFSSRYAFIKPRPKPLESTVMDGMDVEMAMDAQPIIQPQPTVASAPAMQIPVAPATPPEPVPRDFREIPVKVHIRRPEKDNWCYLGRAYVAHEVTGHSSRVLVKAASTSKVMALFHSKCDLQAEKRGNFVVVGCIEGSRVVSWSLNALNNSETLRLLAILELAAPGCTKTVSDMRPHTKTQRRIDRVIKDDRRKRHKRRKDQDAMIDAFAKSSLDTSHPGPPDA